MIEFGEILLYLFRILIYPGIFFILGLALTYDWMYRKILARFQMRVGPAMAGPGGILQTLADFIKTSAKEEITPKKAHKIVFNWLPVLAPLPVLVGIFLIAINSTAWLLSNSGDIYALIFMLALLNLIVQILWRTHVINFG